MGNTILAVRHEVADYASWKAVFDEFPPSKGGALYHRINRALENQNIVTVVSGFPTRVLAEQFVGNPDLKDAMGRAGLKGAPRIELYEEFEAVTY